MSDIYRELHGYQIYKGEMGACGSAGCSGVQGVSGVAGAQGITGPIGIASRGHGHIDENGTVHLTKIFSYDVVQNPDAIQYIGRSRITGEDLYIDKPKTLTVNDL